MQNFSYGILMLLICSSCAQHQYSTIESPADQAPDGTYVFENDSFRIRYSFKGDHCPLKISVFNKLSVPLYIDWRKSSVIVNQKSFPLWFDQAEINTYTKETTVRWTNTVSTSSSVTTGNITRPESYSFIPPDSYIDMRPVRLRQKRFELNRKNANKTRIHTSESMSVPGYAYAFEKENSPFAFRCFLVLSTDEQFLSPQHITQDFWVSDVMETGVTPSSYPLSENQFITTKTIGAGNVILATIVGTAVIVGTVVANDIEE